MRVALWCVACAFALGCLIPSMALAQRPGDALWETSFSPAASPATSLLPVGDPAGLGVLGSVALSRAEGTPFSAGYAWFPSDISATGAAFSTTIGRSWRIGVGAGAASAQGIQSGSGGRLFDLSRRGADVGAMWSLSQRLSLGASAHYAHEMASPDDDTGDLSGDWFTGSVVLGLALPHGLSAALSARHWGADRDADASDDPRSLGPPRAIGCDVAWFGGPLGVQIGGERSRGEYSGRLGGLLAVGDRLLLRGGTTASTGEGEQAVFFGGIDMLLGEALALGYAYSMADDGSSHVVGMRWHSRHHEAQLYHSDRFFVEEALRQAITSALSGLRPEALAVAVEADDRPDEQVRRAVVAALLDGGIPVYEYPGEGRAAVSYTVVQKELTTSESGSWLVGDRQANRRFRATILLRYFSSDGRVVRVANASADVSETIPAEVSKRLENRDFIVRTPTSPSHGVAEMLAGTAILAGLLLLSF